MAERDCIVNLREEPDFIEQYVQLRNRYCDVLLTNPINVTDTSEWLKNSEVEVRGITKKNILKGVVILFLNRRGEIAFFSDVKNTGLGTKLLSIIESVAKERGLREVWAWVLTDNIIAQRAFQKNSYCREKESIKEYRQQIRNGFVFRKQLF